MSSAVMAGIALAKSLPTIIIFIYCFRDNLKVNWKVAAWVIVALQGITVALSMGAVPVIDEKPYTRLMSTVGTIVITCIIIACCTTLNWGQNLFITFFMYNVLDNIDLIMKIGYSEEAKVIDKMNWEYLGAVVSVTAIVMLVFFIFMKNYLRPLVTNTMNMAMWRTYCILPITLFVIYRLGVHPDYFNQPYLWSPYMLAMPIAWTVGTFAIEFLVVNGLMSLNENTKLEEELIYMKILAEAHEKQYLSLREHIEANKRLRHDFRQSLLVISQYAKKDDCEGILKHINAYTDGMSRNSLEQICENVALNTILQYYKEQAETNEIDITIEVFVPRETRFSETDLCVLTGNLLENALEACVRQKSGPRFVKLKIEMRGGRTMSLMLSNSFGGQVRRESEHFLSSKREDDEYGIGIASVQHIAEKYNGVTKITHEGQVFTVYVLLNG